LATDVIDIVGKLNAGDFVTIINIVNNIRLLIEPKVKKSIYMLELLLKAKQNMKKTFCIKIFPYPLVSSALGTSVIMHSESLGMKTLPTKIMQEIISAKKKI